MIAFSATQLGVWERDSLRRWLAREFPDHCHDKSEAELDAYLDVRRLCGDELGYSSRGHLLRLIGYELACGLLWHEAPPDERGSAATRLLRSRELPAAQRIAEVERMLYGRRDHG